MIRTILFATDMGLHTSYLLHHVNTLASQYEARVIVVHAIELSGRFGDAVVKSYSGNDCQHALEDEDIDRIIDGVKGNLVDALEEEFIDGEQQGLSNIRDVRVVSGKPAEVILAEATSCNADMIILGSHGRDTQMPHLLGSVTHKILQLSRVPVYMVPLVRTVFSHTRMG
jgi:nucleotide-binding universal stress UspA family protein